MKHYPLNQRQLEIITANKGTHVQQPLCRNGSAHCEYASTMKEVDCPACVERIRSGNNRFVLQHGSI